ncbi:MAG: ABC transporter permease [Spirochaetaceae bacterium]
MSEKKANNLILFIIFLGLVVVMGVFLPNRFLTAGNFQSMMRQFPEYGLLALAIMLAMITGGIDLSIVGITSLTGVVAAQVLVQHAESALPSQLFLILAIAAAFGVAILCGILNGVLITIANVPALIATLGTNGLFLGIAIVITEGHGIRGFPHEILLISNTQFLKIPTPFIIFALVALLIGLLLNRTRLGMHMTMLGSSPEASQFSGINNTLVLIKTHVIIAVMASISAIIIISRVNSMRPGYGEAYLLLAILIALLGGTNPNGGFGTALGVTLGIASLQVLTSGLNILNFTPFFRKFFYGVLLLAVMVLHYYRRQHFGRARLPKGKPPATGGGAARPTETIP